MTTSEYARSCGVSRSTVARWCREDRIDAIKDGRRWVIRSLNRVIRATAQVVEAVREIVAPAERPSLWASFRTRLHGF